MLNFLFMIGKEVLSFHYLILLGWSKILLSWFFFLNSLLWLKHWSFNTGKDRWRKFYEIQGQAKEENTQRKKDRWVSVNTFNGRSPLGPRGAMFVVPAKFWKYALSLQGTRVPLSIFIVWLSKFHRELTIGSKATHILSSLIITIF